MRTNNLLKVLATLLARALATAPLALRADEGIKTVYHLPDDRQTTLAMNNIHNQPARAMSTSGLEARLACAGIRY